MKLEELEVNIDRRGTFVEAFKLPNDGQVSYILAMPGETRGNHYHLKKTEHFLVIQGSAKLQVRDRLTENVMNVEVTSQKPMVVAVTPNNTHNITANDEGAVILIWCDMNYDINDPDTYQEEI